jgi:hypothetical protein
LKLKSNPNLLHPSIKRIAVFMISEMIGMIAVALETMTEIIAQVAEMIAEIMIDIVIVVIVTIVEIAIIADAVQAPEDITEIEIMTVEEISIVMTDPVEAITEILSAHTPEVAVRVINHCFSINP